MARARARVSRFTRTIPLMKKTIVIAFFFLHALSLGIGSIPSGAKDPLSEGIRMFFSPVTNLYLNATGQWQNWNLFAPDPARNTLTFEIDLTEGGMRKGTVALTPQGIPWMRRTALLKIMRQLWNDGDSYTAIRITFLQSLCKRWELPENTTLRLRVKLADIIDPSMLNEQWDDVTASCAKTS